jgi:hypothetical protein
MLSAILNSETLMKASINRVFLLALSAVVIMAGLSSFSQGASKGFNGKWKGEIPAPTFGGRGGGQLPGQRFAQRGGGGGRGGAGGFPLGNRGGLGGPQKVTLNLTTKNNGTKALGNITIGETTDDVNEGVIDGNKITFEAGPKPRYQYSGTLDGDQMIMTRTPPAEGSRGTQPVQFTLKRS